MESPRVRLSFADPAIHATLHRLAEKRRWVIDAEGPHIEIGDVWPVGEEASQACLGGVYFSATLNKEETPRQLLLRVPVRIAAIVHRVEGLWQRVRDQTPRLLAQGLQYHAGARRLEGSSSIGLTAKESELLEALHAAGAAGVLRESLLSRVWGYAEGIETHTLETHIYRLRQKLESAMPGACTITGSDGYYRLVPGE